MLSVDENWEDFDTERSGNQTTSSERGEEREGGRVGRKVSGEGRERGEERGGMETGP